MSLHSPELPASEDPFVIRGHHLHHFSYFLKEHFSPERYARFHNWVMHRLWLNARLSGEQEELDYAEDVLGPTCSQMTDREAITYEIMDKFLNADGSHPLEVVTATPDSFCRASMIGRHCVQRFSAVRYHDYLDRDGERVDDFAERAHEMGFGNQMEDFRYTAQFSDSAPIELVGVRTVLQVGRAVLSNPAYQWDNDPTKMPAPLSTPDAVS